MRKILIIVAVLFVHIAFAGDFEDGVAAYDREEYATAFSKFRSAALQGSAQAQYNLGVMYRKGEGVEQNDKEAVLWYQLAARQGDRYAQESLGFMYSNGRGVSQDFKEAVRWYRLAAKQGNPNAQYNLGLMYGLGQGVLQDHTRAHMWFNIAAKSGDEDSIENTAIAERKMTPQQIEQAQRMARECMASNFRKCE